MPPEKGSDRLLKEKGGFTDSKEAVNKLLHEQDDFSTAEEKRLAALRDLPDEEG